MGRKIKPLGLHRKAISISLPLDVIGHLDRMVLASNKGLTRSRIVEGLVRDSMLKGQTTLEVDDKGLRWEWYCSNCDRHFHVNKRTEVLKCRCKKWLDADTDMIGSFEPGEEE